MEAATAWPRVTPGRLEVLVSARGKTRLYRKIRRCSWAKYRGSPAISLN